MVTITVEWEGDKSDSITVTVVEWVSALRAAAAVEHAS
jgi:hypothetical protein